MDVPTLHKSLVAAFSSPKSKPEEVRSLLTKPGWNHLEVRTMRGVLSHLAKPDRRD